MADNVTISCEVVTHEDGHISVTVHLENWGAAVLTTLPQSEQLQSRIANHIGLSVMAHLRERQGPDAFRA